MTVPGPDAAASGPEGGRRWVDRDTLLTHRQRKLVTRWFKYACTMGRRWLRREPRLGDQDRWYDVVVDALLDAARNYDPDSGSSFPTYLKWHFRSQLQGARRALVPRGYRTPESRSSGTHGGPRVLSLDLSGPDRSDEPESPGEDIVARAIRVESAARVAEALDALPADQRRVIREVYWSGRSEAEIGRMLGISRSRVRRLKRLGLEALRGRLPGGESPG